MISLSAIPLLLIIAFANMNNDQKLKTLLASHCHTPPAKTPIEQINACILHDEAKWTTNNTHDGEIIIVGDWYYTFSIIKQQHTSARFTSKKIEGYEQLDICWPCLKSSRRLNERG
ncbi:MAG: hypothetical protein ACQEWW_16170 [Bacillota bacterium]